VNKGERSRIWRYVRDHGPLTADEIAAKFGVDNIEPHLADLVDANWLSWFWRYGDNGERVRVYAAITDGEGS
jgi:hypothetical protein